MAWRICEDLVKLACGTQDWAQSHMINFKDPGGFLEPSRSLGVQEESSKYLASQPSSRRHQVWAPAPHGWVLQSGSTLSHGCDHFKTC